jgi:hypothetical protein
LDDPQSQSEVFVLQQPSPDFIARLTAERYAQQHRNLSSLAQRNAPRTESVPASRGNVARSAPIVNVRGGSTADWRPNWLRPR